MLALLQFLSKFRQVTGVLLGELLPRQILLLGGILDKGLEGFVLRLEHLDFGGQLIEGGVLGSFFYRWKVTICYAS